MLRLEIVTPEKRVIDAEVDAVTVPTASGEIGIMPSHAPLVSALQPGVLAYSIKGTATRLAVSGGFVEVNSDKVAVLVDTAETADEVNLDEARAQREAATAALASASLASAEETAPHREAALHAEARLQISQNR